MKRDIPKTAVVTGAASGIGRAISVALGREGFKVGVLDVNMEEAVRTAELVERAGGSCEAFFCDVRNPVDLQGAADHFFGLWAEVGLLVNNAGIGAGGYVGELPLEEWKKVVEINFLGVVYGCHAFIPRMKARGSGHIVNTASIAGLMPALGFSPYNSTKSAVVALSETLKVELAPYNIGVTVLCPSMIKTNIIETTLKIVEIENLSEVDWGIELIETGFDNTSVTPEDAARIVIRAIGKNRLYALTNTGTKIAWLAVRLNPELNYRIWALLHKHDLARKLMLRLARAGII